jgi:actin-related protein 6
MQDIFGGKLKKSFVLPDFHHFMKGYVKPDNEPTVKEEQLLVMETERFAVPELLFSPIDIGLNQAGIPEATWQSLSSLKDVSLRLYVFLSFIIYYFLVLQELEIFMATSKLILAGGNTKFPNFKSRFETDFQPILPDIYRYNVSILHFIVFL